MGEGGPKAVTAKKGVYKAVENLKGLLGKRKVSNIYGKTAERLTGDTELSAYIRSVTELKVEAPTPGHVAKVEGSHKWITKKKLKLARSTTTKPKGKAKKPSKKPRAKKTNFKKAKLSDGKKPKQGKPKAK